MDAPFHFRFVRAELTVMKWCVCITVFRGLPQHRKSGVAKEKAEIDLVPETFTKLKFRNRPLA